MVYMHFPVHLTEEEEMLQKKYTKLRKKKKLLQSLRTQKQEPATPVDNPKKRSSEEAANATEYAKKLLKSGAIKLEVDKKEHREFKRTKRQKEPESKVSVGFQPFSATQAEADEDRNEGSKPKVRKLYDSFVSSRDLDIEREPKEDDKDQDYESSERERERERERRDRDRDRERRDRANRGRERFKEMEPPKKGNTIYVHGVGITEDLVQKAFSNTGTIVNVSMEQEKNCAFVTFDKMESADEAISQISGSMVAGVHLRVSMARRQPSFDQVPDPSTSSWATIAASHSQKGGHRDKRNLVTYDADNDIF